MIRGQHGSHSHGPKWRQLRIQLSMLTVAWAPKEVLGADSLLPKHAEQPNPPSWPRTVQVFGEDDSAEDVQAAVDNAFTLNGGRHSSGEFSERRFAFLFKPGSYNVSVPVGFYTQVSGLGEKPSDVAFVSDKGVFCEQASASQGVGALTTFWRIAENFQTDANHNWFGAVKGMLWATSQAAPLRRVLVTGDLALFQYRDGDAGFASGGFVANCQLKGHVSFGSQQQYFTRNSAMTSADGGVWNMVFVGTEGAPETKCGAEISDPEVRHPVTVDEAPLIAEKPFIIISDDDSFQLVVPRPQRSRRGFDFEHERARKIGFDRVFVADADKDTADSINEKLRLGLHVVLSPGIYHLDSALVLLYDDQVLLGLGLATLVATSGTALVSVADVDGARVAGVLLQAGPELSDALLEWGSSSTNYAGSADNPGFLHDVFVRVGGPAKQDDKADARTKTMIRLNAGNVIGDNLWLWRADHEEGPHHKIVEVTDGANPCQVGLEVEGDDVLMYGLSAEHALQDQVRWKGDRGRTFFFQSELPYDVTEAFGKAGHTGYRVANSVIEHVAYGVGVYHNFRDHPVTVDAGIIVPAGLVTSFVSPLSAYLDGKGSVRHVIGIEGGQTQKTQSGDGAVSWLCLGNSSAAGAGRKHASHRHNYKPFETTRQPHSPSENGNASVTALSTPNASLALRVASESRTAVATSASTASLAATFPKPLVDQIAAPAVARRGEDDSRQPQEAHGQKIVTVAAAPSAPTPDRTLALADEGHHEEPSSPLNFSKARLCILVLLGVVGAACIPGESSICSCSRPSGGGGYSRAGVQDNPVLAEQMYTNRGGGPMFLEC